MGKKQGELRETMISTCEHPVTHKPSLSANAVTGFVVLAEFTSPFGGVIYCLSTNYYSRKQFQRWQNGVMAILWITQAGKPSLSLPVFLHWVYNRNLDIATWFNSDLKWPLRGRGRRKSLWGSSVERTKSDLCLCSIFFSLGEQLTFLKLQFSSQWKHGAGRMPLEG